MYRVLSNITFVQVPSTKFPNRKSTLVYNFAHEFEASDNWKSLTNNGSITLPKNVYVKDAAGKPVPLSGTNINIGGFSSTDPLFLRGDQVTIKWGYAYYDKRGNEVSPMTTIFTGYISQVTSKKPIELELEDNMFILKRKQAKGGNNGFFAGSKYSAESMLREMFSNAGLSFTVNNSTTSNIGDFRVQDETIADVLSRLNKQFRFYPNFNGNELRIGSKIYIDADANPTPPKFIFQQNIIDDDLDYKRKDDLTLSAICKNTIDQATGETTKDGYAKTKKVKLEVLITFLNGSDTPTYFTRKDPNTQFPSSTEGERRTLFYPGAKSIADLETLGTEELKRYYYTGFRGTITGFGIPFTKLGDNIDILDPVLPERNGRYKVKSVKYHGGVQGLRQTIEVDYLVARLDANGKTI